MKAVATAKSRGYKLAAQAKASGPAPPSAPSTSAAPVAAAQPPAFTYAPGEAGRLARRFVERVRMRPQLAMTHAVG